MPSRYQRHGPARHRPARLVAVLCLCLAAAAARAQESDLKAVERALQEDQSRAERLKREAEALEREIEGLRARSIAAARRAQDHESRLSDIEARLADLQSQEAAKVADLKAQRRRLGSTLAALQRIALQPADALLFAPGAPVDTVRSGLLLRVAIPAIERRAAALRDELRELDTLREGIARERGVLAKTTAALDAERVRLAELIRGKSATRAATAAEQQAAQARAARLASQAKDLRELLDKVEREARERAARAQAPPAAAAESAPERPPAEAQRQVALAKPDNIRPFPTAGASLLMPARGRVLLRYGQSRGDDRTSRGIVVAVRRGAQVVAPYDGKVVYAGTFRRYGQILIIEHGGRYHTLLAGLDRIDAVVGQWLLAGEPVGVMGAPEGGDPELYLELRHAGQPINPLPWLATTGDKVRG